MKAREGFVIRNIMGDYVLSPTGSKMKEFQATIVMNDLTAFVWNELQHDVTRSELLKAILEEYDVDQETAAKDLDALLKKLREFEIIED